MSKQVKLVANYRTGLFFRNKFFAEKAEKKRKLKRKGGYKVNYFVSGLFKI